MYRFLLFLFIYSLISCVPPGILENINNENMNLKYRIDSIIKTANFYESLFNVKSYYQLVPFEFKGKSKLYESSIFNIYKDFDLTDQKFNVNNNFLNTNKNKSDLNSIQIDYKYLNQNELIDFYSQTLFKSAKYDLNSQFKKILNDFSIIINNDPKYANCKILIEGHTDNLPIKKSIYHLKNNTDLSIKRAVSVANFLIDSCNMKGKNIFFIGLGASEPRTDNGTISGRQLNRYIRIKVLLDNNY
jgi:flagellar motor protein MotB